MSDKAAYVKSQRQTRNHECHWPGCTQQVPPAMWGCKRHWLALPKALRDKVWRAYVPGQEKTMTPSPEYLEVAREVQDWIYQQKAELRKNLPDGMVEAVVHGIKP